MRKSILMIYAENLHFKFSSGINVLQQPVSKCCIILLFFLSMMGGLSSQTIKTVGTGGDYASLTTALTAVGNGTLTGVVELQIISDITETATPTLAWRTTYTSLKIYPTGAAHTLTVSNPITINSANVTIDGSIGGVGTGTASLSIKGDATVTTGILVEGSSANSVTGFTVKNCNIYDFLNAAINIGSYVNTGTISDNSIYNDLSGTINVQSQYGICVGTTPTIGAATLVSGRYYPVLQKTVVAPGSIYALTISHNYIGGSQELCGGTAWTRSAKFMRAIYFNGQNTTAATNTINSNIIQNISSDGISTTTQSTAEFEGINGIEVWSGNGSAATTTTIDGNMITNLSTPASATANRTLVITAILIAETGTGSGLIANVTNNQINNLTNNTTGYYPSMLTTYLSGIFISPLATPIQKNIVTNNTIHDFFSYGGYPMTGIECNLGLLNGSVINQNTIYKLYNKQLSANAAIVTGIKSSIGTASNNTNRVSGNKIYDLNVLKSDGNAMIRGIWLFGGYCTFDNNIISLGTNATDNVNIRGIQNTGWNVDNCFYYNSVYIGGTTIYAKTSNVFEQNPRLATNSRDFIRNNIFVLDRTQAAPNFVLSLLSYAPFTTGIVLNNNNYYATGVNKLLSENWGATVTNTLPLITSINSSTFTETGSLNVPVTFVDVANGDLRITDLTTRASLAGMGTSVYVGNITDTPINDFYNTVRSTTAPTIGAHEFAVAATASWNGLTSTDWNTASNWTPASIPTALDDVIIPVSTKNPVVNQTAATPAVCSNLTIDSGAALSILSGKALTVSGTLTNKSTGGIIIQSNATGTGSLIAAVVSGTGTATVQSFMKAGAWHMTASPLTGQTIVGFLGVNSNLSTSGSTMGMMDYNPTDNIWNNHFAVDQTGDLVKGKGFAMHTSADGIVTYTGALLAGTQTITGLTSGKWNCIGNPFTSAIGINSLGINTANFLNINSTYLDPSYGAIYVWDKSDASNGLANQYTIVSNVPTSFDVQQGQAFFILLNPSSTSISFTPAMQYHNATLGLKAAKKAWPTINITASVNNEKSTTLIAFNSKMTKGLDPTYDAGLLKGGSDLLVYTRLVNDNGIPFGIQALPDNDFDNMIIPIGIDYKTGGEVQFSAQTLSLPAGCKVILEDKLTKTFTDLSTTSFKVVLAANSSITDRFLLHTADTKSLLADKLSAFAIRNTEIRVIGQVSKNTFAILYNINGKVELKKNLEEGNLNIIPLSGLKAGLYLLQVNENGKLHGFKILVME